MLCLIQTNIFSLHHCQVFLFKTTNKTFICALHLTLEHLTLEGNAASLTYLRLHHGRKPAARERSYIALVLPVKMMKHSVPIQFQFEIQNMEHLMDGTTQPTIQKLIGHCMPAMKTVYGGIEQKGTGGLDLVRMLVPRMDFPILSKTLIVQTSLRVFGGAELQMKYFLFDIWL
jgi:hypothetical protein